MKFFLSAHTVFILTVLINHLESTNFKTEYIKWPQEGSPDQKFPWENRAPCPQIVEGVFGDWRLHAGCAIDNYQRPHRSSLFLDEKKSPLLLAVGQLSEQLVRNTLLANEAVAEPTIDQIAADCKGECLVPPACCPVSTEVAYPLFAVSASSKETVEIVQGQNDVMQPVVFRKCTTTKSNIIIGHCEQTYLPRFMLVYADNTSTKHVQDAVLMPVSCDCVADLQTATEMNQNYSIASSATSKSPSGMELLTSVAKPPTKTITSEDSLTTQLKP